MSKPERVSPAELDEAVKEGVERAEQVNELSQDELDGAAGGLNTPVKAMPGMFANDGSAL